jgi:serine/threonine-protein kinase
MAEALRQVLATMKGAGGKAEGRVDEDKTRISSFVGQAAESQKVRLDTNPSSGSGSVPRSPESRLDPEALRVLEDKLIGYVGPIARILVRTTAGRSRSVTDLCAQLALSVAESEREKFRREVDSLVRSRPALAGDAPARGERSGPRERLPEHELERVQEALAQFLGPIARVLVRRATTDATSVEALWLSLSNHIDAPAERAAFLKLRQR